MHEQLGDTLLALVGESQKECMLVAPYMKTDVLGTLLGAIPTGVEVTLVSQWRPSDVARGVSDLDVLDLALRRRGTQMLLCDRLHAKYFRADRRVLLGSANLTQAGLGWSQDGHGNLELLVERTYDHDAARFECSLLAECYPASTEHADALREAAAALPQGALSHGEDPFEAARKTWLPQTRHPADLFKAYCGLEDSLSTASSKAAKVDLAFLEVPRGLDREGFRLFVRARLLGAGVVQYVDEFVAESRRFGAVRDHLRHYPPVTSVEFDASYAWQTLFRWLLYFLPDRYNAWTANYSEIIQRRWIPAE